MTEIQQNRWDQLIRRTGNVVGGGSQVGDTLNELFPTIDVETIQQELAFLSGWQTYTAGVTSPALAANNSLHQLFNPVGSGKLIVLERLDIRSDSLQFCRYLTDAIALTNFVANPFVRDTRLPIATLPVGQIRNVQQAGTVSLSGIILVQIDVNEVIEEKKGICTLRPGTGFTFASTTQNSSITTCWWWRERNAEPAELNF